MTYRSLSALIALVLSMSGCAAEKKPAASPALSNSETISSPVNPKPDDDGTRGSLNISEDIRTACGLTDAETFFAFDSADVHKEDGTVFKKLAVCFESGALKGREMRLIGYADPRGAADYNLALGGKRADNVKAIIERFGLNAKQVFTSSRGAMDATGTDEVTWAKDRRVEASIGN